MRLSLLAAVVALAFLAPAASARTPMPAGQNLSSPDAQDANAAKDARTLQDLARLHAQNPKTAAALAQEKYYSSYGPATSRHSAPATTSDNDSPVLIIALGLGLTLVVAGAVTMAVRTRRRVRVAV
jgi:hypothetical protein